MIKKYFYSTVALLLLLFPELSFSQSTCPNGPVAAFSVDSVHYSSFSRLFTDNSTSTAEITNRIWYFGNSDNDSLYTDTTVILYKYNEEGTYTVTLKVIDKNNCSSSVDTTFSIEDMFIVPNVFTPNSDNVNDQFIVTSNGINKFSITIYSRWGKQVFYREGQQQIVWDGKLPNGKLVPVATYYYVISVDDSDTIYEPEKGFISVFY